MNREMQGQNKKDGSDWYLAKGSNQFASVSEYVHKSAVPDCGDVEITLSINGVERQRSNTNLMIFDVPSMIADISKYQSLGKGDLIFTGTPQGVGAVKPGDKVVCTMRNGAETENLITHEVQVE